MSENKKILGARSFVYNDIKFRSVLECSCYKKLEQSGFNFSFESEKIILWEGVKLCKTKLYAPNKLKPGKYSSNIEEQTKALIRISYTPDFVVIKDNYKIYFDVKGKENDTYPIKKKMFLKILEDRNDDYTYMFFEPHSVKQMLQAIEVIKNL